MGRHAQPEVATGDREVKVFSGVSLAWKDVTLPEPVAWFRREFGTGALIAMLILVLIGVGTLLSTIPLGSSSSSSSETSSVSKPHDNVSGAQLGQVSGWNIGSDRWELSSNQINEECQNAAQRAVSGEGATESFVSACVETATNY